MTVKYNTEIINVSFKPFLEVKFLSHPSGRFEIIINTNMNPLRTKAENKRTP